MSEVVAKIENDKIIIKKIRTRQTDDDTEIIPLQLLEYKRFYNSKIKVTNEKLINKVLLLQEIDLDSNLSNMANNATSQVRDAANINVVIVYTTETRIKYAYCSLETAYKRILKFRYKVLKLHLSKKKIQIKILGYLINNYDLQIQNVSLYIDQVLNKTCKLKEVKQEISKLKLLKSEYIYNFSFDMEDILQDVSEINGNMRMAITVNDETIDYRIAIKERFLRNKRYYYAPIRSKFVKEYAIHFRRTPRGNLVLVKRLKEPVENTFKFKIMESKIVSNILYLISSVLTKIRLHPINLFYEKFSSKAEEGAFDLFKISFDNSKKSKNYFVIDENSEDYQRIKAQKNVIKKYSLKYYWLVYNANNFISTEAPIHLNILRSNNASLRKSMCDKPFIFLQHGITYMKCQGDGSTFAKGKEGESKYIVVGSDKEKDAVVDMLKMREEDVLVTGLPIFSNIKYNHINQSSDDIITIMLTWKPYEEQLYDFKESTYYKNTVEIYNMLLNYIDKEKIYIIPHPKIYDLLSSTDLYDNIWLGKISEILEKTKMLITDYSSVCYNSFYQGAGVVFYQPDLVEYEAYNGKLVPTDDEYIGKRAFSITELENIVKSTVINKSIDINQIRNQKFIDNYKTINEFSDGKNLERIYNKLIELNVLK